jgi:hypothetical protein
VRQADGGTRGATGQRMVRRLVRRTSAAAVRHLAWAFIAMTLIGLAASMVIRGDAAGSDFQAYRVAAAQWLAGADPYDPPAGVLPYVYAPWGLPLFIPWALLPDEVAFVIWRAGTVAALLATLGWATRRRPVATATVFAVLSIPLGINLDTGNLTLPLALGIFGSRLVSARAAGMAWGAATALKWATLPVGIVLGPTARRWGLATLAVGVLAHLLLWPMTLDQLRTIAELERPVPIDYLVLTWAAIPWLWSEPRRRRWLHPATWVRAASNRLPRIGDRAGGGAGASRDPASTA